MLALGWGFAAVMSAIAGLMAAASLFVFTPSYMLSVLIYAFAAAVLGGIESPGGAVLGGLLLGVTINLLGTYVHAIGSQLQLPVALLILLGVLLVRPAACSGARRCGAYEALRPLLVALAVGAAVVIVLPALVTDFRQFQLAYVGVYFIAILGLNLLTGYSGQISLGHGGFMMIGAYTTSILSVDHGVKDVWTIPLAGLVAGAAGFAFGWPGAALPRDLPRARDLRDPGRADPDREEVRGLHRRRRRHEPDEDPQRQLHVLADVADRGRPARRSRGSSSRAASAAP